MSEEHPSTSPIGELLQSFQHIASLIMEAAADEAQTAATAGAHITPDFLAGPLGELAERVAGMTESLTGPLHKLLAEQHRKMSAQIATWAEEHRRMTEQMQRLVKPLIEQTESVATTSRVFVRELRH